jgi:uncharacterized membrane protein YedE/YeeE
MSRRAAGAIVGIVFGVVLSWTGMVSPDVIRGALLFEDSYLFLFFGSAVATAFVGLRLVRGRTALLGSERIEWSNERPQRRHIVGSLVFGAGWGIAHACPGPVAAQVGQGVWWAVFTLAGVVLGVYFFLRHQEETEPAAERVERRAAPARA